MRDLFRGYNKLIRPVQNMTQKVEVAFGLAFIQLINVVTILMTSADNFALIYLNGQAFKGFSVCVGGKRGRGKYIEFSR